MNHMLVVGASGLVGRAATEHFHNRPGWSVTSLSRRRRVDADGRRHISVDLADPEACIRELQAAPHVTHVLYSAVHEHDDLAAGWRSPQQMDENTAMLRNLLDAVERSAEGLEHVTILQGGKAYGSHLGRYPAPAKERWPRMQHDIFYWPQEDLLRERAAGAGWRFSILRPQMILGDAVGSPMSIVVAIGAYAAIMRELGEPLRFPGGGEHVNACSDSGLIAEAVEYVATTPSADGETFNVVNGDVIVWQDLWPAIADHFHMAVAEPRPMQLAVEMPKLAATWEAVASRHGLSCPVLADVAGASWQFADLAFAYGRECPPNRVLSPIKLRQHGFAGCRDTEDSFTYWLSRLQAAKILPR